MIFKKIKIFFLFLLFISKEFKGNKLSNNKIYLIHADIVEKINFKNSSTLLLSGNICFKHKNLILNCEKAIFYEKENKFTGYGNIKIISNNWKIIGGKFEYNGNYNFSVIYRNPILYQKKYKIYSDIIYFNLKKKIFKAIGNSSFLNKDYYIKSNIISYNLNNKIIYYKTGGFIYNNYNIINSNKIFFYINKKKINFYSKLIIENNEYKVLAKKSYYFLNKKKISFLGPTIIIKKKFPKEYIYTENGNYYISEKKAYCNKYSSFHFNKKIISSNNLFINQKSGFCSAYGNVWFKDLNKKIFFNSGYLALHKFSNSYIFLKKPFFIKIIKNNFFFIKSDIIINNKKNGYNIIRAYKNVKIYNKNNIQSVSKNFIYNEKNKKISFYKKPIFFFEKSKISGNELHIFLKKKKNTLKSIKIIGNGLIINEINLINKKKINQISGDIINIFFKKKKINYMEIKKNSQIIFFIIKKNKKNRNYYINDLNKLNCEYIIISFKKNKKIYKFSCIGNINSFFIPRLKISKKKYQKYIVSNFFYDYKKKYYIDNKNIFTDKIFYYKEKKKKKIIILKI